MYTLTFPSSLPFTTSFDFLCWTWWNFVPYYTTSDCISQGFAGFSFWINGYTFKILKKMIRFDPCWTFLRHYGIYGADSRIALFHFGKFVCLSFRKCVLGKRIVYSRFSFHFLWYEALVLCILLCLNWIHTYVHVHHVCMLVFYIVRFVISTEFYNIRYLVNKANTWGNRALLQILYTI